MDQVISAAVSSHPVAISGNEKAPNNLHSLHTTARPAKQLRYILYPRLCYRRFPNNVRNSRIFLSRNQHYLVDALPLQAVTTDDSEDSTSSSSSSPSSSVHYDGVFPVEKGERQSLLYCIRIWYSNARNQDVSTTIKRALERSKTELQNVDRKQVFQQIIDSTLSSVATQWWETTEPWIKWPVCIFVPWYVLISLVYGMSTSTSLLPLWTIGPIIVGLAIKAAMQLWTSFTQWAADRKFNNAMLSVIEGIKTGQLLTKAMEVTTSRLKESQLYIQEKKSRLVSFIESGELAVILKQHLDRMLVALWEVSVDKYEDFRLFYLYVERKLKNII